MLGAVEAGAFRPGLELARRAVVGGLRSRVVLLAPIPDEPGRWAYLWCEGEEMDVRLGSEGDLLEVYEFEKADERESEEVVAGEEGRAIQVLLTRFLDDCEAVRVAVLDTSAALDGREVLRGLGRPLDNATERVLAAALRARQAGRLLGESLRAVLSCFPTEGAVAAFTVSLDRHLDEQDMADEDERAGG